ncbi:MAG: GNAT family N-acetyltransferase [Candidatus Dojkabacteria bacterium]
MINLNIIIEKLQEAEVEKALEIKDICKYISYLNFSVEKAQENINIDPNEVESLKKKVQQGNLLYFSAKLNNNIVGYLGMDIIESILMIRSLFIHPDYQGKGVGSKLLLKADKIANSNNCSKISLNVVEDNSLAIKFYKKNGFIDSDSSTSPLNFNGQELKRINLVKVI